MSCQVGGSRRSSSSSSYQSLGYANGELFFVRLSVPFTRASRWKRRTYVRGVVVNSGTESLCQHQLPPDDGGMTCEDD